jgi:hypothetical protein
MLSIVLAGKVLWQHMAWRSTHYNSTCFICSQDIAAVLRILRPPLNSRE